MSKLETNTIDNISGSSTLNLGDTNATAVTINSGVGTLTIPNGIATGHNYPAFRAELSSNQSFSGSTEVKILNNLENYDTDNAYDNSTNYRFTVPTGKAGKYLFISSAKFGGVPANNYGRIRLYVNGTANLPSEVRIVNATADDFLIKSSHVLELSAGDYVEMYIRTQDTGTNEAKQDGTYFSGFRIGA